MNWRSAAQRQALVAWRDEQTLAAYRLLSAKTQEARAAFDRGLVDNASLLDTILNPVGFAEPRIDVQLRKVLPRALADFLDNAATGLADVAPEFAELAEALRQNTLILPQAQQTELDVMHSENAGGEAAGSKEQVITSNALGKRRTVRKSIEQLAVYAREAVKRGEKIFWRQADTIADTLQHKAGLWERARIAAHNRIGSHWLGETGEPQSVLSQLISIIEETTEIARNKTL